MTGEVERQDPFGRTYARLRAELAGGTRAPGSQIRIDETARSFQVSPTPVREALSRLAGERLVVDSRRHGYFVPMPASWELAQLYELIELHLLLALTKPGASAVPQPDSHDAAPLFVAILRTADRPILHEPARLAIERLATARQVEGELFDLPSEMEALHAALSASPAEAAKAVRSHLRARRGRAEQIAALLARSVHSSGRYFPAID